MHAGMILSAVLDLRNHGLHLVAFQTATPGTTHGEEGLRTVTGKIYCEELSTALPFLCNSKTTPSSTAARGKAHDAFSTDDRFSLSTHRLCQYYFPPMDGSSETDNNSPVDTTLFTNWCESHASPLPPNVLYDQCAGLFYLKIPSSGETGWEATPESEEPQRYLQRIYSSDNVHHPLLDKNTRTRQSLIWDEWIYSPSPIHLPKSHCYNNDTPDGEANGRNKHFTSKVFTNILGQGMHRTLQHAIRFFPHEEGKDESSLSRKEKEDSMPHTHTNNIRNGTVTILFPLGEEMYIDLDDPSPHDDGKFGCKLHHTEDISHNCQVELVAPSNRTVDIEQPSFVSPQNVISFHIHFSIPADNDMGLESLDGISQKRESTQRRRIHEDFHRLRLEFFTTLHFRYLDPIPATVRSEEIGSQNVFALRKTNVSVPALIPYSGELYDEANGIYHFSPDRAMVSPDVIVPVSVGSDGDFAFVATATAICSILGTLLMMRDVLRISKWR